MHKNSRRIWRLLKQSLRGAWREKSESERTITLPGGGSITVVTTKDADNIRSEGYDGIVCDEAAFMADAVWRRVLRPMLIDKQGWAIWITTPNGENWWKQDIWDAPGATDLLAHVWGKWQQPSHANKLLSKTELADLEHEYRGDPAAYAQEILAQFVAQAGAEFPSSYFERIWSHDGPWPSGFDMAVVAVDPSLGKSHGDMSAVVSAGLRDGLLWIDADIRRRPTPQIVADAIDMAAHTPALMAVGLEGNGFQVLLKDEFDRQLSGRMTLPLHVIDNTVKKEVRIRRIAPYLLDGKIRFRRTPGCEVLENQLRGFPLSSVHDDGPDALEMCLRLLLWLSQGTPIQSETRLVA